MNDNTATKPTDHKIDQIVKSTARRIKNMKNPWIQIRYNPFTGSLKIDLIATTKSPILSLREKLLNDPDSYVSRGPSVKDDVKNIEITSESKRITDAGDIYLQIIHHVHKVSVEFNQIKAYDVIDKMFKIWSIQTFLTDHVSELTSESDLGENCANKIIAIHDEYVKQLQKHNP